MTISHGEHLLRLIDSLGFTSVRTEIRTYLLCLERVENLARQMYEHELALRTYQRGSYRICTRCMYVFRARTEDEICPFCVYAQTRPRARRPRAPALEAA